jgi:hypothetical protein
MKAFAICLLVLLFSCQQTPQKSTAPAALLFPQDWLGQWRGTMQIVTPEGIQKTLPIGIELATTGQPNRYRYLLQYGTDTTDVRSYELVATDSAAGLYLFDELNGIRMEGYMIGQTLYSQFDVDRVRLMTSYQRLGDSLISDIVVVGKDAIPVTGDTIMGRDTIPPVYTHPVMSQQRGVLYRKN